MQCAHCDFMIDSMLFTVIAQVYENASHNNFKGNIFKEFAWDPSRTLRITVFGGIVTVWLHGWWNYLERVVEKRISAKTHHYSNALTKVFLDQAIGAPIFNILFFTSQQVMQGKPCDASLLHTGALQCQQQPLQCCMCVCLDEQIECSAPPFFTCAHVLMCIVFLLY